MYANRKAPGLQLLGLTLFITLIAAACTAATVTPDPEVATAPVLAVATFTPRPITSTPAPLQLITALPNVTVIATEAGSTSEDKTIVVEQVAQPTQSPPESTSGAPLAATTAPTAAPVVVSSGASRPPVARVVPGTPEPSTSTNLLTNPGWEAGYTWNADGLAAPNGWVMEYAQQPQPFIEDQENEWLKPETVVWRIEDAPAWETDLFFLEGGWTLKVFGAWKPVWVRFSQVVTVPPGTRLRFSVPVYPDAVEGYAENIGKVFSTDPLSSEVRLFVTTATLEPDGLPVAEGQPTPVPDFMSDVPAVLADTGYTNGYAMRFGEWSTVVLEFTMPASGSVTVAFEVRGRWGLVNNGWFTDDVRLEVIP